IEKYFAEKFNSELQPVQELIEAADKPAIGIAYTQFNLQINELFKKIKRIYQRMHDRNEGHNRVRIFGLVDAGKSGEYHVETVNIFQEEALDKLTLQFYRNLALQLALQRLRQVCYQKKPLNV